MNYYEDEDSPCSRSYGIDTITLVRVDMGVMAKLTRS